MNGDVVGSNILIYICISKQLAIWIVENTNKYYLVVAVLLFCDFLLRSSSPLFAWNCIKKPYKYLHQPKVATLFERFPCIIKCWIKQIIETLAT